MERFLHRYGELIVLGVILLVSATLLIMTNDIIRISEQRAAGEAAGPKFWPTLILSILTALTAFALIKTIIKKKKEPPVSEQEEEEYLQEFHNVRLIILMVLTFLFIFALQYLGFMVSSVLYLIAVCYLIRMKWWKNITFSIVSLIVFTYVFGNFLTIPLPRGLGALREISFIFY